MKERSPATSGNSINTHRADTAAPIVLYVEDNADNRYTAKANLGSKFNLLFATNDHEACRILVEKGRFISVILMDIELKKSELNGIELTKLIRGASTREKLPEYARQVPILKVPIIFLTAYGNKYERSQIIKAGGNDLLEKPVDFVSLKLAITKYNLSMQKGSG